MKEEEGANKYDDVIYSLVLLAPATAKTTEIKQKWKKKT